ncbi:hypothetical protein D9619_007210 [Psilocybe cf. subviscida]|uniref:Ras GEF n=1 Tax=Psilocybe cf. subviscida TaxID=2480587 RepID=A0A8H5B342_9AGAR|nr:hypothetical protein D9619_007210 [Psilocybe cf. subviscida]
MYTHLSVDTAYNARPGPSSDGSRRQQRSVSPAVRPQYPRGRSVSNASSSSYQSMISPTSSSTNGSTTSLEIPTASGHQSRSRSASPVVDETVRLGPEYVLAMHDFVPQQQASTCLAFRAGQVIHVFNRDPSGWWDGELDGRRGWFPSNYVNATSGSQDGISERSRGHSQSQSESSMTSFATNSSRTHSAHARSLSIASTSTDEDNPYCPPLLTPLLHGLSLLQNAVRTNRATHFQPSTACIISCVRSILASTDTLQRDATVLQQFPSLAEERKRILMVLAALVAQAKKASDVKADTTEQEREVRDMLRLGGQVFSNVRSFLAVAVKCGVELPEDQEARTATLASAGRLPYDGHSDNDDDDYDNHENPDSATQTPTQYRGRTPRGGTFRPNARIVGPRLRDQASDPNSPGLTKSLARARQEQYLLKDRTNTRHKQESSVSSISSASSFSSHDSAPAIAPPFPCGPSTAAQVMEALRYTHDHYLSTIAAFIGHAHSHSRTSYASSTGVLYDLVKEIVEMVCKLLTIVEAAMQHPEIPANRLGNLKAAKEGLYNVTSSLAESVRLLTVSLPSTMSEESEKQVLLRSATGALKAGADCVAAVKVCLNRSVGDKPFIVNLPSAATNLIAAGQFTPIKPLPIPRAGSSTLSANAYHLNGMEDEDLTIQAQTPSPIQRTREISSGSDNSILSKSSWMHSIETRPTSPEESKVPEPIGIAPYGSVESDLPSPSSIAHTDDDGTTWEGSNRDHLLGEKIIHALPNPMMTIPEYGSDPRAMLYGHDYPADDAAYNSDGHLVGATMEVLVEKLTPHDSIVDPGFASIFFLTFRLFSTAVELADSLIERHNIEPPFVLSVEDKAVWQQRKGLPVRLRVSNFIKLWLESHWRPGADDEALPILMTFNRDGMAPLFPGPAARILELLHMRRDQANRIPSPLHHPNDRSRDPMSLAHTYPNTAFNPGVEIPRPTMNKALLAKLRVSTTDLATILVTEFDALELARQLTLIESSLYCGIQPEEILESGQGGSTPPVNVRALSTLSTEITGWITESILNEADLKKRTLLVKFFVKVADRCVQLNNFSTSRSILAALDSSVISRLRQTWNGLPQKYKAQLEALRKLADHSRNSHEYRTKLRNTMPPAIPFLGVYLTDVTFCREGNPSYRASPTNPSKKLLNFNKYHKLARIIQDMQRFQVPYSLRAIPEVKHYLTFCFEQSKRHGGNSEDKFREMYNRSLLLEPRQAADQPPTSDMRQLFNWATRSTQPQTATSAS